MAGLFRAHAGKTSATADTLARVQTDSILVVDDEVIVLDVLTVALKKAGFTVFTAASLYEANELVEAQRFACALIDKNLPDGSGLELIRTIRAKNSDCTCLVMTAYPNADSILEALKLGAIDYLEKPFPHVSIIQEKVKAAVERQRRLAALSARVAEMNALKAAAEVNPTPPSDPAMQAKYDSLNFRHQRALSMLREVKSELDKSNASPTLLARVTSLLEELK